MASEEPEVKVDNSDETAKKEDDNDNKDTEAADGDDTKKNNNNNRRNNNRRNNNNAGRGGGRRGGGAGNGGRIITIEDESGTQLLKLAAAHGTTVGDVERTQGVAGYLSEKDGQQTDLVNPSLVIPPGKYVFKKSNTSGAADMWQLGHLLRHALGSVHLGLGNSENAANTSNNGRK